MGGQPTWAGPQACGDANGERAGTMMGGAKQGDRPRGGPQGCEGVHPRDWGWAARGLRRAPVGHLRAGRGGSSPVRGRSGDAAKLCRAEGRALGRRVPERWVPPPVLGAEGGRAREAPTGGGDGGTRGSAWGRGGGTPGQTGLNRSADTGDQAGAWVWRAAGVCGSPPVRGWGARARD